MIEETRKIYRCEFCKPGKRKTYLAEWAARDHEASCLYNPRRVCRTCSYEQDVQGLIEWLMSFVRFDEKRETDIFGCPENSFHDSFYMDKSFTFDKFREKKDCPFCQMAALLQMNYDLMWRINYDFKDAKNIYFEKQREEYMSAVGFVGG